MSDFTLIRGFEEVWRPPVGPHRASPQTLLHGPTSAGVRARLSRLADRTPEVMVKVTGRTRDGAHLKAHLDYISRNGGLPLETADGVFVIGRHEVAELAAGWAALDDAYSRGRANSRVSRSVVLSMPAGTDPVGLRDAGRAFAEDLFTGSHDYVFALHTDTPRPHVHLSICSRGRQGQRLNPKKADLERWRQVFAEKLRERGIAAEATPRRARGVSRKAERTPIRKIRERHEAGRGEIGQVRRSALREASRAAFQGDTDPRAWEARLTERQARVRALYLAQAKLLKTSGDPYDRQLGWRVEAFVEGMARPDTQRLALARELRAAARSYSAERGSQGPDKSRGRR